MLARCLPRGEHSCSAPLLANMLMSIGVGLASGGLASHIGWWGGYLALAPLALMKHR